MIRAILLSINFLLISFGQTAIVPLPSSTGPCDVTLHASELVDMSRTNPYDPKGGKRSIMVTTFTPVNCGSVPSTSYMPNATAKFEDETFQSFGIPPGTFESLRIQTQTQQQPLPFKLHGDYPVVLFSPALATSRLMYTLLLQDIASNGFAVVSVDHPYDADIVEYPDGRTVLGRLANISTTTEFVSALNVRVKDMVFLLDQMHDEKVIRNLFPLSQGNLHLLSLDRVTILGHSLGGATAAQTILVDNRFVGGINLDGALWGSVVDKGLSSPFLLFGNTNHTQATDRSWAKFSSHSRGWKLELQLAQSKHYTFSDIPLLVDALGVSDEVRQIIQAESIGTIGGLRAKDVITSYTIATLQYFVYGHTSELLSGPSVAYPDVTFVS
ncbi:Platelet-activating factor acetylhydrolase [Penicillium expansum]|uniref:1-alkyl-2-acetylglycerophosphocholine esterase n=1 Tax=Penicillium expansum TaxID=27334 RepID=A0A0A2L0A2_PENEN|nr:Platelet-activating factor acetylhydrolase [Penicillium expansum]KGO43173.1 Platelet-activating factor acetylhydrolase [Penicillium expansum]KGO52353.1 Platelet-activating factor acetylhydrolase [Penicillium expansum]KGO72598.1 Platelet-activating factor acetylhydrolase [Penicillium expansum]